MKKFGITLAVFLMTVILYGQTVQITSDSKIKWTGEKAIGTHWGYLRFDSGELVFDDNVLKGGHFVVDMKSLEVKDTSSKKLLAHIKSDDFFDVENYPTAELDFKSVDDLGDGHYKVTGSFTIKGKSNDLSFKLTVEEKKAHSSFKFDRQEFDVKMKNSVKDAIVYDDIKLDIELKW
ncbi:hypothetical protein UJ101_02427 [Flavobacteriaceae bacterium UJ101]|nr:hypothetical protein UJ101_02427 [Flavobacteriaceae bacterium UJ101]